MRGNHDDRALSAYQKVQSFGPKVLLMLSSNPLFCTLVLLPIHTAVCSACLHASVLSRVFAPASLLAAFCAVSRGIEGCGWGEGGVGGQGMGGEGGWQRKGGC